MEIFPAIDLRGGHCVRLSQGDFAAETVYEADPVRQAQSFATAGALWLHMVDLDGAKAGRPQQTALIGRVVESAGMRVQVGGGLRTRDDVATLLALGVQRVIVGSMAVKQPDEVKSWMAEFGADRIVLALDVRLDAAGTPEVLTHGWQAGSQTSLWQVLDSFMPAGLQTLLCTDVARDGMLSGTNHQLYSSIQSRYKTLAVLASGGVDGAGDLQALERLGLAGAIVGKAVYERKLDLAALIKELKNAG